MSYIGSTPTTQSFIAGTDYFNGDGSTVAFTLSRSVVSVNDIEAVINNVEQQPNTAYTVSGTTITFTSAPSAGTGNIYVRYLSTTTQSITPSQNTVSYSTLNSDNQSKLGISFKNRIINGAMTVSQRYGTSSSSATDSSFSLDRWKVSINSSATVSAVQSTTAPAGFSNSLLYTVTSGSATSSTQFFGFRQGIEGYNIADLNLGSANAKTFTISFWVNCSLTGTYAVTLTNSDESQKYPTSYTVNTANTWEQKTITVTGSTTATWNIANGLGLSLQFYPSLGTSYRGTANAWTASAIYGPSGLADFVATTGNTMYITGVQLEVGTQATTFDYRSYGTELQLCQRYAYLPLSGAGVVGLATYYSSTRFDAFVSFPTTMRTYPSLTAASGTNYYSVYRAGGADSVNSLTLNEVNYNGCTVLNNTEANGTAGDSGWLYGADSAAKILFSAEL